MNHAMLFRSSFNDNSSAGLGEKTLLIFLCESEKNPVIISFETMFLPKTEKRIAKLVFFP